MFKRTFLKQARAPRSLLSVRSASTAPLAVRRASQFQPQLLRPFSRLPTYRRYSTENKTENGETQQKENGDGEASQAADPITKELEEKKKEIVELKVNISSSHFNCDTICAHIPSHLKNIILIILKTGQICSISCGLS